MNLNIGYLALIGLLIGCSSANQDDLNAEDQYIVVLKERNIRSQIASLKASSVTANKAMLVASHLDSIGMRHQVVAQKSFAKLLSAGVYTLTAQQAKEIAGEPEVAYVEKDHYITVNAVQSNAPWGLDRVDQESLPLNGEYDYPEPQSEVHAYIVDTGVNLTHQDFADRVGEGFDFVDNDDDATDCNGHGTHVAGTVGGSVYGVAKSVVIHGVRVLDCNGGGRFSDVIAGIEWVSENHVKPAVANLSLGGPTSQAVDDAVVSAIQAGVTMVLAAGNSNTSACNSSPARVTQAITVGSTTSGDARSSFSNFGTCVDLFAPGSDIKSAWHDSDTSTRTISGTSMAAPHVAGVVALYLGQNPNAAPDEVAQAVTDGAISNTISDVRSGSPNLLLNIGFLTGEGPDPDPEPDPEPVPDGRLQNGVALTDLAAARGEILEFSMDVPAGAKDLSFTMSGGSGDADIYVKFDSPPSLSSYDCRPFRLGNNESCPVTVLQEGTYHVAVRAYSSFSGVKLVGQYTPEANRCPDCQTFNGELSGTGQSQYFAVASSDNNFKFELMGPSGTDFDLYLEKQNSFGYTTVARSLSTRSEESINYSGSDGVYRVRVLSFRGQGAFVLKQE